VSLLPTLDGTFGDRADAVTVDGESVSFEQLAGRADALAAAISDATVVAVPGTPTLDTVIAVVAGLRGGVPVVPVPADAGPMERAHILRDSGASVIAGAPDWPESELPRVPIPTGGEPWGWGAIGDAAPALIMYTSGTTGRPKGVVQTHRIVRNPRDCADRLTINQDDVLLNFLPLFHCFSFNHMLMMSLVTGATQILIDRFSGEAALDAAERYGATILAGFDTHFRDLNRAADERDMCRIKLRLGFLPAGLDSSTAVAREAQQKLCPTASCYGMTETWPGLTVTPPGSTVEQRCEASGTPMLGYEFRIIDPESGASLPAGQVGEIHHRGYSTMLGYLNDAEATTAALGADGWLRTGDMGMLRLDGHLRFMGRYKDMLKVGGENVSPAEVEAVIAEYPGVSAVAVVGVPHARMVEVPAAFVVSEDRNISGDRIAEFCASRLAPYKVPRTVILIDALPTTSSGKVQKNALRDLLKNENIYFI